VHVEWDTEAALTPLGQLPFFIDFLKAAGLCDAFIVRFFGFKPPSSDGKRL
jgi:hypothetical protein